MSARQKDNARVVWVKRAQFYHSSRLYMHALYRRRSELDDRLLKDDLAELCLSPYTRVRRYADDFPPNRLIDSPAVLRRMSCTTYAV